MLIFCILENPTFSSGKYKHAGYTVLHADNKLFRQFELSLACIFIVYTCSFHNKLKHNPAYLGGHMNKRVDHLLMVLLRIEEDMFFEYERKRLQWSTNPKLTKEHERHKKGLNISSSDVKVNSTYIIYMYVVCRHLHVAGWIGRKVTMCIHVYLYMYSNLNFIFSKQPLIPGQFKVSLVMKCTLFSDWPNIAHKQSALLSVMLGNAIMCVFTCLHVTAMTSPMATCASTFMLYKQQYPVGIRTPLQM